MGVRNGEAKSAFVMPRYEFVRGGRKEESYPAEDAILSVALPLGKKALPGQGARGFPQRGAAHFQEGELFFANCFANVCARE